MPRFLLLHCPRTAVVLFFMRKWRGLQLRKAKHNKTVVANSPGFTPQCGPYSSPRYSPERWVAIVTNDWCITVESGDIPRRSMLRTLHSEPVWLYL